jgi:hypothetical protein
MNSAPIYLLRAKLVLPRLIAQLERLNKYFAGVVHVVAAMPINDENQAQINRLTD